MSPETASDDFQDRPTYMIRLVGSALGHQVDRALREFSLTATQLGALSHLKLASPDGLSGAQLAQRVGVTPQSMATAIAGLVSADLVRREAHPIHGRILEVRITPQGLARRDAAQAAIATVNDRLLGLLDAGQQQQLREILRVLMDALDLHVSRGS